MTDVTDVRPFEAWEAFTSVTAHGTTGTTWSDLTTVRRLEDLEDRGRYDWPDGEVHHAIAGWQITCHGDDPDGAFVQCWGRSDVAVSHCLELLTRFVTEGGTALLWPVESET